MDSFDIDSEGPTNRQALNHWPLAEGVNNRNIASSDKGQRFVSLSLDFNLLLINAYAECITKLLIQFWTGTGINACASHWSSTPDIISKGYFRNAPSHTQNKLIITTNRGSTL